MANALSGKHEYHVGTLIARRLAANGNKGDLISGIYATLLLQYLEGTPCPDDTTFPFVSLDLVAMKRHLFVTRTSDLDGLDYILRFEGDVERQIHIPAPLVFDFSRRNGYRFSDTQFDEITGRYQFHDPTEGVVPDEEECVVYPPVQVETIAPWGEGSSSGWGAGSSSTWEDPRTSVYAPEGAYDPRTYQHYPGAGGSWGPQ